MPLFMDLHIVPEAVLDDVVEAHKMDVAIQDQYGCNCMTFWFDQPRGQAFCLIEAPDKESVIGMHNHAHGLIPHKIMEVNSNLVTAFLGRLNDPDSLDELSKSEVKAFYNDPAFRIILVVESLDFKLLSYLTGKEMANNLYSLRNKIFRQQLGQHEGQEIEIEGKGLVASFVTSSQAVACSLAIREQLDATAELFHLKIGLHAGVPVANSDELFGETIRYAGHLCLIGQDKQVILSDLVNGLHKEDKQKFSSNKKIHIVSPEEEIFLEALVKSLSENWNNHEFDIGDLSRQLGLSTSQLYRKTISSTGLSPNAFLRSYRLIKSLDLLKKGDKNISQAAYDTGFNSPSYFAKCFQKKFGLKPVDYQKQKVQCD